MLDPDYGCLVLRVIFGTVGVKGYDWLKEHGRSLGPDDPKPADKTVDRILTVELDSTRSSSQIPRLQDSQTDSPP